METTKATVKEQSHSQIAGEQKNKKNRLSLSLVSRLYTICLSLAGPSFFFSISFLNWLQDGFQPPIKFVSTK